jgi:hypothetical protein
VCSFVGVGDARYRDDVSGGPSVSATLDATPKYLVSGMRKRRKREKGILG